MTNAYDPRTKREWTEADKALVRRIAEYIAAIHDTASSTSELLINIDEEFPDAPFKAFVGGYFLFQIERSGALLQ
jgi:hypothetical protein